tara:strand:+ start:1108 stop:2067 length:960 start_codon:yes stop_codon:yes gene_type:complete
MAQPQNNFENIDEHVIIQSRLISLNSKFATKKLNGSKLSSLLFDFNSIVTKDIDSLYNTVALQSAEIPSSYYNVNTTNNTINLTQGGTTASITIPVGNYDANTFAAAFIVAFNAAAFANNGTLAFSTLTGKFSLMSDQAGQNLTINLALTTARKILGIDDDATGTLAFNYSAGNPTFMPLIANFLGVTKIKILSDALAGGNYDSNNLNTTTLMDTISATAPVFGLTVFSSLGRESFVKGKRIDEIDLQILDQDNNFIDFNGINWTMTLLLNTHRRQTFSKVDASILNDRYEAIVDAQEKPEPLKKEVEELFDMDNIILN